MKLSIRESQILELLQAGMTNKEIGQDLAISPHTVRDLISDMLTRFDQKGRTALVALHISNSRGRDNGDRRTIADRRLGSIGEPL